jgi:hypothetical protein
MIDVTIREDPPRSRVASLARHPHTRFSLRTCNDIVWEERNEGHNPERGIRGRSGGQTPWHPQNTGGCACLLDGRTASRYAAGCRYLRAGKQLRVWKMGAQGRVWQRMSVCTCSSSLAGGTSQRRGV